MTFFMIDMVQSTKKSLVDSLVPNQDIKKLLNEYVDTQTDYTKKAVSSFMDINVAIYSVMTNKEYFNNTMKSCMTPFGSKGK